MKIWNQCYSVQETVLSSHLFLKQKQVQQKHITQFEDFSKDKKDSN